MRDLLKTLMKAGIPFGCVMGLFFGIIGGLLIGVISGIISGLFFGLILGAFMEWQKKKFNKQGLEVTGGKPIVYNGGANHFLGSEGVGGWMFLTDDELIFKSHSFNFQNHKTVILLSQIDKVIGTKSLGIIPNGLLIIQKNGQSDKFVVNNRRNWLEKIRELQSK